MFLATSKQCKIGTEEAGCSCRKFKIQDIECLINKKCELH